MTGFGKWASGLSQANFATSQLGMIFSNNVNSTYPKSTFAADGPGMSLDRASYLTVVPAVALMFNSAYLNAAPRSMNYETCATSSVCVIRGIATVRLGEHAPTVELQLGDGRCVNVSMPRERLERLRRAGPTEMTVTGHVYHEPPPSAGEEHVLQINGRTIGYGLCGNFFVFVAR